MTLRLITAYYLLKLFMGSIWSSEKRAKVILLMVTIHTYIPENVLSFDISVTVHHIYK